MLQEMTERGSESLEQLPARGLVDLLAPRATQVNACSARDLKPAAGKPTPRYRRRVIALAIAVILLVIVAAVSPLHSQLDRIIRAAAPMIDVHPIAGPFIFMLLSAMSAMLVFFSSALLLPVAVVAWGREATLFLLWIGWLAGGALSYVVGRYPGRTVLHWLVRPRVVLAYEKRFSSRTALPLVILLQLAMPSEVPGYVLGSVRYSFTRYMLVLALAELPYGVGAVYLGDGLVRGEAWIVAVVALAGAVVSIVALTLFHRRVESPEG
jgi:uncharacterized membrane protein YdjX (TVP38/TMEM64 family)